MSPNNDLTFDIKNLIIFNSKGTIIIQNKFKNSNNDIDISKMNKMILRLSNNKNIEDFKFFKFFFNNNKLTFLFINEYVICGLFSNTRTCLIKMYLLHMFIALENFFIDYTKNSNKYLIYDSGNKMNNFNDNIILKLFEV
jgi:hypothetical protein